MRILWQNALVGVGAGALDEVMEMQDSNAARTESFKTWTDWSRVGLAAIGYLGQMFNFFPALAGPLAQSEITLVTKSVSRAIQARSGAAATVTTASRTSTPASAASLGSTTRKLGWRPLPIGV